MTIQHHKPKSQTDAAHEIVQKKIREFQRLHPDPCDNPPTAVQLEACTVAVITTLLWVHGDQTKRPLYYCQEATHVLRQLEEMIDMRMASAKPKVGSEVTFTPNEAAKVLGYTRPTGFWEAVERYFGHEWAMRRNRKKRISYGDLMELKKRVKDANAKKAAKGRAAKAAITAKVAEATKMMLSGSKGATVPMK